MVIFSYIFINQHKNNFKILVECPRGTKVSSDGRICELDHYHLTLPELDLLNVGLNKNVLSYNSHKNDNINNEKGVPLPTDMDFLTEKVCVIQQELGSKETKCVCDVGYKVNLDRRTCKGLFFFN